MAENWNLDHGLALEVSGKNGFYSPFAYQGV